MKKLLVVLMCVLLVGCAMFKTVRQQDLDIWVGVPVEALDTHSFFLTLPMIRTVTESGIEIRNYANVVNLSRCSGNAWASGGSNYVNLNAFSNCIGRSVGCHNLFYIKDGKVIEYAPTGRCYTDETTNPQPRYLRLIGESK